jgi:histone-lysine N-methyltransferase SETD3
MLLLWSIRERYNPSSKFKIYFEALPANFNTGLSFGIDALAALEGTLLFDELMQARQAIYCYGIVILILQITIQLV